MAAGALPVFCDVLPGTLTLDPDQVQAAVTSRTRAIMPVHLGHQMADMDRLTEIARRYGLALVEDCAHAHGQRWRDRGAGSFGEFGSFSHQSTKLLTAGEGGSLLTDDERLARRAHSLIDCGRAKDADEKEFTFGANYRLGELHAALLLSALERLPGQQAERAEAGRYFEELASQVEGVRLLPADPRITRWSFYRYILLIEPEAFAGASNLRVCEALEAEGVGAWEGYQPMSRYDLFQPALSRTPTGSTRPGCRSRWPRTPACAAPCTWTRTSSGPAGAGSRTRSRPWPKSNATPASWPARKRTSAGRAGWPPGGRRAGARPPGTRGPRGWPAAP